jgi:polar amino acid transport system substrate-binding protein
VLRALVFVLLALVLAPAALAAKCPTVSSGKLTVGTDNPAYPPWFGGKPPPGSPWKVSDPRSGEGYEAAVAYAVATRLGFKSTQVEWKYVPFNRSFAPGPKPFDFDINQISYTPARAKVVTFSNSYYDVNQALVVLAGTKIAAIRTRDGLKPFKIVVNKGTKIASVRSVAGLKPFKLGAQLGTTSYAYIKDVIRPSKQPAVYQQNAAAVQALKNKQIDGLVVDLPTAFYVSAAQVQNSKVRQFPVTPGGEHFGMVFAKGNPLAVCVNAALARRPARRS